MPGAGNLESVDGEINAYSQGFVGNQNGNGRDNNYGNSDYYTDQIQDDEVWYILSLDSRDN